MRWIAHFITLAGLSCISFFGTSCTSMSGQTGPGVVSTQRTASARGPVTSAPAGTDLDRRAKELSNIAETEKTREGCKVTLQNELLFDFDRASLRYEARQTLNELADILVRYPGDQLRIEGFTDYIGPADYNRQLSEERAQAVRSYLASQGIEDERMKAIGMGEVEEQTNSPDRRRKNRRVEIFIRPQPNHRNL